MIQIEELINSPAGDNVCIEVDDLPELGLFPQIDLGKGRMQIGSVHQVEICWFRITDSGNWYHVVEYSLWDSSELVKLAI